MRERTSKLSKVDKIILLLTQIAREMKELNKPQTDVSIMSPENAREYHDKVEGKPHIPPRYSMVPNIANAEMIAAAKRKIEHMHMYGRPSETSMIIAVYEAMLEEANRKK